MIAENTPSKCSDGTLVDIWRIWLPHGMRPMPNNVRTFGMPRPAERRRRCDKKDGLRMGNTKNAARPISRIAYRALRPDRLLLPPAEPGAALPCARPQQFQGMPGVVPHGFS